MTVQPPGRIRSPISGFMGLFAASFGIFWTVSAARMGAPFAFMGLFIIAIGIYIAARGFIGTKAIDRPDVSVPRDVPEHIPDDSRQGYCPYCGSPSGKGFEYCRVCGKRLP